ncbi:MAG: RHS repeat protein, partial [Deltaproteobacteria bacterium]|nr:RHS repeat protein [Deltaproteobacteria bacterium]
MCCQTDEHAAWSYPLTGLRCAPTTAVYDECDPGPEPPGCRGPANNVGSCIGDPVDVTTGNLEQMATDLDLGRGLAFTRHYASDEGSTTPSPLGPHWRSSLDWRLVYDAPDTTVETALVWRPLGGSDLFLRFTSPITQTPSPWTGGTRAQGGVTGGPASGFVYTHRDGTRVYFGGQTRQLEKIEPPGEAPIVVGSTGSLTTFRQGEACFAVARTAGRVESVASRPAASCDTGPNDQLWTYAYDAAGCLATVTAHGYPGVAPPQGQTQGIVSWSYTYEDGSCARLERVERAVNSVSSQISQWTYDAAGRVTSIDEPALDQKLSLAYPDTAPTVTEVRNASGTALLATVTAGANRTRIESVSGPGGPGFTVPFKDATFTQGPGAAGAPEGLWRTTIDLNDVKTLYEEHDTRGRPRFVTEGWRDLNGNGVIDGTEAYERRREYTYHPRLDAPLTITQGSVLSPAGNRVETSVYDPSIDRLVTRRLEGFTLDANGAAIPFLDETTYGYDASARLTSISGPRPAQHTEIDYDPASGSRSALRRYLSGPGSGYLSWSFSSFDSHGNPQNVTDPNGRTTAFTYDGMGRVLTATPPYEGSGSTTLGFSYDVDGNLIRVDFPPDSAGNPVFLAFGYDAARPRLLQLLADSQGNAIVYTYENGRVQREQRFAGFTSLASPGTPVGDAAFSYTNAGHLFRAFNPLFPGGTVHSEFGPDPKGNPTRLRDENGKQDLLLYDALDRLTRVSQVRAVTYETDFTYDALSNVTSVTDAAAKATALLHDDRGNLVETVSPDTGTTRFLYDAAGNLVQKIEDATPAGARRTTSYGYDGLNRLGTINLSTDSDWVFTYDTDVAKNQKGRLAQASNGEVTTQLEYTRRGDVAAERTIVGG